MLNFDEQFIKIEKMEAKVSANGASDQNLVQDAHKWSPGRSKWSMGDKMDPGAPKIKLGAIKMELQGIKMKPQGPKKEVLGALWAPGSQKYGFVMLRADAFGANNHFK